MTLKYKNTSFDLKAVSDDGFFSGYASVFGNVDSYGDVVVAGAFAETIAEWSTRGKMPPVLWNHRTDEPIGMYTLMKEDAHGLYVEGQLLASAVKRASEVLALMKAGVIDGLSIGYEVQDYKRSVDDEITELLKIKLWEVSIVTFPANELSRIE